MIFNLLIIILCGCCCLASSLPKSTFDATLTEFKHAISSGEDFNPILNQLNMECQTATSEKSIKTHVAVTEEIIALLMKRSSTSISLKTPEIQKFKENLMRDITENGGLFSLDHFESVSDFLIETSDGNLLEFMSLVTEMLPRMTPEQAKRTLKRLELAQTKLRMEISQDKSAIYDHLMEIFDFESRSNDFCVLKPVMADLLLLDFAEHPEWLQPFMLKLMKAVNKLKEYPIVVQHLINFIMSDKVIDALPEDHLLDSYAIIMYSVSKAREYTEKFNSISSESRGKLQIYHAKLEETAKIYKLINFVTNLTENSEDYEFELAQHALSSLKVKSRTSDLAKEIVILSNKDFEDTFKRLFKIFKYENKMIHLNILFGLLYFDLAEGMERRNFGFNVISGIGLLLAQYDKDSPQYPSDYIQEILPNIDEMCEATLSRLIDDFGHINGLFLNAIIKAFQLNPVESNGNAFVDRLCTIFISDRKEHSNKFTALRGINLSDERSVYLTAFVTFLKSFEGNPNSSKLPYLDEYFMFLKSMGYLSEPEILLIENIMKFFKE